MKRNLSSKAIKAMAIGMAVTLGSTTAISGVITGTVVNTYAQSGTHATNIKSGATITKDSSNAKIILNRAEDASTSFGGASNDTEGFILKKGADTIFTGAGSKGTVVVSDNTITINIPLIELSGKLNGSEDNLSISYVKTGSSDIQIDTTNPTFTSGVSLDIVDIPLTGSVDTIAPTITSAVVKSTNSSQVEITFSENVKAGVTPTATDFNILAGIDGTTPNAVTGVSDIETTADNNIIILTLTNAITADDKVKLYYTNSANSITDDAGNIFSNIDEGSKIDVTNELASKDIIAPAIESAVVKANNSKEIVLTFTENITADSNPDATDFKVLTGANSDVDTNIVSSLSNIDGSGKTLTLTLTNDITYTDVVKVYYTKSTNAIKDTAGNELANIDKSSAISVINEIKQPVVDSFTVITAIGTYTFEKLTENTVALKEFTRIKGRRTSDNKFENGVLTAGGLTYTLTQIGTGIELTQLTDESLDGHTNNVTTIKENAFKGNINVTNLSFPKVKTIEANAFTGATSLTTIDLGSQVDEKVTISQDAFTGATAITNVTTNIDSKDDVTSAAQKGNNSVVVDIVIDTNQYNKQGAKIEKDKYYITSDGLLFKGLDDKNLTFIGSKEFKAPNNAYILDGTTEDKAYFVTYKGGHVTLSSEQENQTPVEENEFTATYNGHTLTFKKIKDSEVSLTNVAKTTTRAIAGNLSNGVLTVNEKEYNLTELGDGTNSLGIFEESILEDNLNYVTTVKANAFSGNTSITTITLPAVTTIEANAFNGTTALTTIDLGNNDVTITQDAFKGAGNGTSITIKTNSDTTKNNITTNGGGSNVTVDNPAPEVLSAEVNKEESEYVLTLTLSEKVFSTTTPNTSDFVVTNGIEKSKALTPNAVKTLTIANDSNNAKNTIKLTLTNPVYKGEKVTVKYTQPASEDDKKIKDTSADAKTLVTFDENKVTIVNSILEEIKETITITNAKVNDTTLTLTTSESNLKDGALDNVDGFTVKKGSSQESVNISSINISGGNTITLTLETGIADSDTEITFAYNGSNSNFVTSSDISINSIDTIYVKNELDTTVPTLSAGTFVKNSTNGGTITLDSSEPLSIVDFVSDTGFTVNTDTSSSCIITKVEVKKDNQKQLLITVSDDLTSVSQLKVTYTKPSSNKIVDLNGQELDDISSEITITPAVTLYTKSLVENKYSSPVVITENGTITGISSVKNANQIQINNVLVSTLTHIYAGAFNGTKDLTLDFTNVSIPKLTIEKGAFNGASRLDITGVKSSEVKTLAEMIGSNSGVSIGGKTTEDIIKESSGSSSGGGSSSSSGNKFTGSGANIGNTSNNITENNSSNSNNNNNNTSEVIENKTLTLASIKLPSVTGEAKVFSDVSANHWAKSYIDRLSTAGVINGSNGMFNPNGQTKRADVTIMLVNLLGLQPEANNRFTDVNSTAYYAPYVGTASTYGIVNGSNGMFNPEGIISRQDTMVMIAQILKSLDLNVNTDTNVLNQFSDASNVSSYAIESVSVLVNSGIISGNNGKLNPTSPVTRAEMATIMSKLYDVLESATK